jgi:hypothetical protein
VVGFVL